MFKTANRDQLVRNEELSAMKRELYTYISDDSDFQFLQHTHTLNNEWGGGKGTRDTCPFPDVLGQTGQP